MERYQKFRKEFPRFYYHGYKTEETEFTYKITYDFEIEGLSSFAPTWTFPKTVNDGKIWKKDGLFRKMIFSLGMVELVSYWKITCSPEVIVEAGVLNDRQILWWKDLYFNGLGEFFYVNDISEANAQDFMEIHCRPSERKTHPMLSVMIRNLFLNRGVFPPSAVRKRECWFLSEEARIPQ